MKSLLVSVLTFLVFLSSAFSQGTIDATSFYSQSLNRNIPLKIYKPQNYSATGDPYRVYIYLHGGLSSVYADYAGGFKGGLDLLIQNNEIDPILVVYPLITFNTSVYGTAIGGDLHWFVDSKRNGNYASAISIDLLEWLEKTYNVSLRREERAVGGFSMGALGAVHMAIYDNDKFIACVSHGGSASVRSNLIDLPTLFQETPGGPPYHYNVNNGLYSTFWFSLAAAFSPNTKNPNMPGWYLDFPFDDQGKIINQVFVDQWMAKHDPATLMVNNDVYKHEIAIYFDATLGDVPYNDILELELLNIGHVLSML
jgi:hypothetical protein